MNKPIRTEGGKAFLPRGWREPMMGTIFSMRKDIEPTTIHSCLVHDLDWRLQKWQKWFIIYRDKSTMPPHPWPDFVDKVIAVLQREESAHERSVIEASRKK